jgi:hypothetical protein
MLDRSLKAEFESYRKTLSTDGARPAFDERIERLLNQHGIDYVRGYVDALKECIILEAERLPLLLAASYLVPRAN